MLRFTNGNNFSRGICIRFYPERDHFLNQLDPFYPGAGSSDAEGTRYAIMSRAVKYFKYSNIIGASEFFFFLFLLLQSQDNQWPKNIKIFFEVRIFNKLKFSANLEIKPKFQSEKGTCIRYSASLNHCFNKLWLPSCAWSALLYCPCVKSRYDVAAPY